MSASYERVLVESVAEWRGWLQEHAGDSPGIWLVRWKRGRGAHVPYDDVVEQALCFGWVDSQAKGLDERQSMLLVTPRRPRSGWSRSNKERVERLLAAGLMALPGLAAVEAAKANGAWSLLDDVEALREPAELAAALAADPAARTAWTSFPRSAKRAILEWIAQARTEPTRAKRIALTVAEAHEGRRANEWRPKQRDETTPSDR